MIMVGYLGEIEKTSMLLNYISFSQKEVVELPNWFTGYYMLV